MFAVVTSHQRSAWGRVREAGRSRENRAGRAAACKCLSPAATLCGRQPGGAVPRKGQKRDKKKKEKKEKVTRKPILNRLAYPMTGVPTIQLFTPFSKHLYMLLTTLAARGRRCRGVCVCVHCCSSIHPNLPSLTDPFLPEPSCVTGSLGRRRPRALQTGRAVSGLGRCSEGQPDVCGRPAHPGDCAKRPIPGRRSSEAWRGWAWLGGSGAHARLRGQTRWSGSEALRAASGGNGSSLQDRTWGQSGV